jgi:aconitate decarboxylase
MNTQNVTDLFVQKIRAIDYQSLPPEAIDMAKAVFLDGVAVILAGSTEPLGVGRITIDYVREMGGSEQASVMSGGFKTSMLNAAYANGTMAHALDFDNTWYPLNHPTSPTLPAILAIAEFYKLSGAKVIESIAAAFEVQARLRMAAISMGNGEAFHKPGMTGTFGACAAACKLLDLDQEQSLMAFGIAGSRAGSLAINTGTMTKSSHSGHAARMGVECGLLAKRGWTASADVFGPKGFFDTFMHGIGKPELLIEGFANPLRMVDPGVGFKKHPCNYFTHRPIDAALTLRKKYLFETKEISCVEILFPRFDYVDRAHPKTGLDGKFSVQYTTAIALLDGEITIDSFTNERRFASDVVEFLKCVKFVPDESIPADFDQMYTVVTVILKNGKIYSQKVDKLSGWVGSPLSEAERLKKVFICTKRLLSDQNTLQLIDAVGQLDQLKNIDSIMDIVRC